MCHAQITMAVMEQAVSEKSLQSGRVGPWIWAVTFQGEKYFSRKKSLRLREEPIAPWFLE